ncbi:hypothetical protein WA026_014715, partial [Henosepilachna vigintioctopunctata]
TENDDELHMADSGSVPNERNGFEYLTLSSVMGLQDEGPNRFSQFLRAVKPYCMKIGWNLHK